MIPVTRSRVFGFSVLAALWCITLATTKTAGKDRVFADNIPVPGEFTDPFVWDDIVLRGTFISVQPETIPAADWFSPGILQHRSNAPAHLLTKVVKVHDILRGCVSDSLIVLTNLDSGDEKETRDWISSIVGREAIITARYKQWPHPAWVLSASYVRAGSGWTKSRESKADTLSDDDIRNRVAAVAIRWITRESDLVVRGKILSRRNVDGPGDRYDDYAVRPMDVLKGSATDEIMVRATSSINRNDGSQWRSLLGYDLAVGTSWYLFLMKREDGLFQPAGAWRSAFRIEGDHLFERLNSPSCYTPSSLENEVRWSGVKMIDRY